MNRAMLVMMGATALLFDLLVLVGLTRNGVGADPVRWIAAALIGCVVMAFTFWTAQIIREWWRDP